MDRVEAVKKLDQLVKEVYKLKGEAERIATEHDLYLSFNQTYAVIPLTGESNG